jgi:hypothetical protein
MAEIVIENLGQLRQTMDAARWFAAIRRAAPRALVPLTVALRQTAPRPQVRRRPGTARLGDRFDVAFVEDVQQGLVKGVSVAIAARVPYASPVSTGTSKTGTNRPTQPSRARHH